VTTGAITGGTNATVDDDRAVGALVAVSSVSLFGGEVTADSVTSKSVSRASPVERGGDLSGSGSRTSSSRASVTRSPNAKVALGDWGYAIASSRRSRTRTRASAAAIAASSSASTST
jgi:hypothetical protein